MVHLASRSAAQLPRSHVLPGVWVFGGGGTTPQQGGVRRMAQSHVQGYLAHKKGEYHAAARGGAQDGEYHSAARRHAEDGAVAACARVEAVVPGRAVVDAERL